MSAIGWRRCSSTGCARTCGCSPIPPSSTGYIGGKVVWGRPIQTPRDRPEDRPQHLSNRRLAADADLQPGPAAIEAVLQPRRDKELYFVADGSGGHAFAETLKDHNANVQKWRLVEKDIKAKAAVEPPPEEAAATSGGPGSSSARVARTEKRGQARAPRRKGSRQRQRSGGRRRRPPSPSGAHGLRSCCGATLRLNFAASSRRLFSKARRQLEALNEPQKHDRICQSGRGRRTRRLALGVALGQQPRARHPRCACRPASRLSSRASARRSPSTWRAAASPSI